MTVAVCLKWVDRRPELSEHGVADPDARFAGVSAADQAALEFALRSAEAGADDVLAITLGPAAAVSVLRDALAAGARRAVHVVAPTEFDSAWVAATIAPLVADARQIWCGDYSLDRGTGSVPAFLAAELGAAQALGLVEVEFHGSATVTALRRLDGGRRERLSIDGPAVLSVEGGIAQLRRASLAATLRASTAEITAEHPALPSAEHRRPTRPYRPRPRVLPAPSGDAALERIQVLTDSAAAPIRNETLTLSPSEAAHHIVAVLADWGYLPPEAV